MAQQITLLGVGDILANRYRLIQELGRGSYGVVWRAQQVGSGQDVAVKTLLPQAFLDPEIPERFDREIQLVSRLKHPNIVALHDHGQHNGLLYMTIEFIEGRSLGELIKKDTPLPAAQVIVLMRQILGALGHAHAEGIVHRDLKPENILLQQADPRAGRHAEVIKVLDFGIAKLIRSARDGAEFKTLTQSGHVLGTPHYMSPEQIVGDNIDHRTDLYAIGIILYELLTGVHPFDAPNSTAVMVRHLRDDPAPLPAPLNTSRWAQIIRNVLTKQPEDRYPSAQAFLAAIEQAEPFAQAAQKASKKPEGRSGLTAQASRPLAAAGVEIADLDMTRALDDESTRRLDMDERATDEQTRRLDMDVVQTSLWSPLEGLTQMVEPLPFDPNATQLHHVPSMESADALRITPPSRPVQHTSPMPAYVTPATPQAPVAHAEPPSTLGRFAIALLILIALAFVTRVYLNQQAEDDQPVVVEPPPSQPPPSLPTTPNPTRPATQQAIQDKLPDESGEPAKDPQDANPTEERPANADRNKPDKTKPDRNKPDKNRPKVADKAADDAIALRITSEPPDARVVLDGKPIGNTPLTYKLSRDASTVQVKLSLIGYRDHQVRVLPAQQPSLHVRLEKGRIQLIP